jgi:hypothetical protein
MTDKVSGQAAALFDSSNMHDILTGSRPDGTAFAGPDGMTRGNWARSSAKGAAMVGHHHRMGLRDNAPSRSWNASHASRGGCSQTALQGAGGAGLFYCFAAEQGGELREREADLPGA